MISNFYQFTPYCSPVKPYFVLSSSLPMLLLFHLFLPNWNSLPTPIMLATSLHKAQSQRTAHLAELVNTHTHFCHLLCLLICRGNTKMLSICDLWRYKVCMPKKTSWPRSWSSPRRIKNIVQLSLMTDLYPQNTGKVGTNETGRWPLY